MELNTPTITASLAALLFIASPVRAEAPPGYGGEIEAPLYGAPTEIDPLRARRHADVTAVSLVFDSLYRAGPDGDVWPSLAAGEPQVEDGGLVVRIELVSGVRFHDGRLLAAGDVAASLRRVLRSRELGWLLAPVRAVDAESGAVILRLRRPETDIARLLASPATSVTPGGRVPTWTSAVGTGPFALAERSVDKRSLTLRAFDDHHRGRPYLDTLILRWFEGDDAEARAFELGRIHASMRGAVAFVGHQPKYRATRLGTPASVLVYLGAGSDEMEALGPVLSLAIDRRALSRVGSGEKVEPSAGATSRTMGGVSGALTPRIRRAARRLTRARRQSPALERRLRSGPLEVFIDRSRPDDRAIAERVLAGLYQLGVRGKIVALSPERFAARVRSKTAELYIDNLVTPVAGGPWPAAAALAAGETSWLERALRRGKPRVATIEARLNQAGIVPLLHRALELHVRSNLHGFEHDPRALIRYGGVFERGQPQRPGRRR